MNERIESYLKQHYCRDYFNSYGETVEDDHYFMYREEVDGLIELIVRECASVVKNLSPGYNDYRNQIEDAFRSDCVEQINQHFGVEQ